MVTSRLFSPLLIYFVINLLTTDYFWVIHLLRKHYIHISCKEGGGGKRVWVMELPLATSAHTPIIQCGRGKDSNSSATSSQYFTLPHHHSEVEGREVCVFSEGILSPESAGKIRRRWEDVVWPWLCRMVAFSRRRWAVPLRCRAQPEEPAAVAAAVAAAAGHQGEPPKNWMFSED